MKKLVIIGGGFSGSTVARKLENEFDVILIDNEDYFEYTPGILRTLLEPEHWKKIQAIHKNYLKKAEVINGYVYEVGTNFVRIEKTEKKIKFDYLVIASGSKYNSPIKEENIIHATRIKHLQKSHDKLMNAKNICIIGGGLVGVELAAEISTHCDKNIRLIHSHERLIDRNNLKSSKYAHKFLRNKGVMIKYNERVKKYKKGKVFTEKGKEFDCDFAYFTIGIKPNFEFMKKNFSNKIDGGIIVDKNMRVHGMKNMFAAGDMTNIREEKTAQNAERQALVVINNLRAMEKNTEMKEYKSKKRLMVISLGKYNGIIEYKNFVMYGFFPALVKWGIERYFMKAYKSKD